MFRVNGRVGERLVYRGDEDAFEFVEAGRTYGFDADDALLRLASEAYPLRLLCSVRPFTLQSAPLRSKLPHQITAVYGEMLPRQRCVSYLPTIPARARAVWPTS